MNILPPLNALRTFEAAARHLSFNRAAEELHVTPSAVSHQIRMLEEFLGIELFDRLNRQVVLTSAGIAYQAPLHAAFEQIRDATRRLSGARDSGPLTISVAPSFAIGWLVPRLPKFQIDHPGIEVRVSTSVELVDLARSDIDVGIRSGRGEWRDLCCHRLMTEELVAVCSPALARGRGRLRRPNDLARAALLHDYSRLGRWRTWLTHAGVDGIDPDAGHKFQSTAMAVEAAVAGLGVAITDRRLVQPYLDDGRLVAPFDVETPSEYAYYLVYPEARAAVAKIAAFRDWVLSESDPRSPGDD